MYILYTFHFQKNAYDSLLCRQIDKNLKILKRKTILLLNFCYDEIEEIRQPNNDGLE